MGRLTAVVLAAKACVEVPDGATKPADCGELDVETEGAEFEPGMTALPPLALLVVVALVLSVEALCCEVLAFAVAVAGLAALLLSVLALAKAWALGPLAAPAALAADAVVSGACASPRSDAARLAG